MGRPEEVAAGIRSGRSPRSLAQSIGISQASVVKYLNTAVGSELLSRSEILFAIEDHIASTVEAIVAETGIRTLSELRWKLIEVGNKLNNVTREQYRSFEEDALLYFRLREAPLADMYESLCRLETFMHAYIKRELEREHGPDWWRKGIPTGVRRDCVLAKEEDPEPQEEPYCYTTFIHLRDIFDKQWGIFCQLLPKNLAGDKSRFLSELVRLNAVRNRIMHPVRGYRPKKHDFEFVKDFAARMFAEDPAPSAREIRADLPIVHTGNR